MEELRALLPGRVARAIEFRLPRRRRYSCVSKATVLPMPGSIRVAVSNPVRCEWRTGIQAVCLPGIAPVREYCNASVSGAGCKPRTMERTFRQRR